MNYEVTRLELEIAKFSEENSILRCQQEENLRVLAVHEAINDIISQASDIDDMLHKVLDNTLETLNCDRAWLLYPCDPTTTSFRIPMERTRPQWPGANAKNVDLPVTDIAIDIFLKANSVSGPVKVGPGENRFDLDVQLHKNSDTRSQMVMTISPKPGETWLFGIHNCEEAVEYGRTDSHLFEMIGKRINSLLPDYFLDRTKKVV